jgi:hypothetical protein
MVRCFEDHAYEVSPNFLFNFGVNRGAACASRFSNAIQLLSGVGLV